MRRVFILFSGLLIGLILLHQEGWAQQVTFKERPLRFRTSYEKLQMQGEPNLGMLGLGADFFIVDRLPNFYLSLNSYSAIVGKRPGLITFGTGLGYLQPLFNSPLALDAGIYVGGGGGADAPDGGGLITRGHVNLNYRIKNVSVFGGYSRLDFPTGAMGSHQVHVGLALSSVFRTAHPVLNRVSAQPASSETVQTEKERFIVSPFRATIAGQNYLGGDIYLLGVELDQFFHQHWYAALKLHGAVAGGIDGYMSYLVGLGYEYPLLRDRLLFNTQLVAGPSGGGTVNTGGGGIVQGSLGLRAGLGSSYDLKAGLGYTYSPRGTFHGTFLEVGVGKSFQFISSREISERPYTLDAADLLHKFGFEIMNRTYFSPDLTNKSGQPYDRTFNLLGFRFSKRFHPNFDFLGATYWAYQGSYGAYAEGLLGLGYRQGIGAGWEFGAQLLGGAAGGGDIDLGDGLVFQYSAGLTRKLGTQWDIGLGVGQMQGIKGNFRPIFTDIGFGYRFSKAERK